MRSGVVVFAGLGAGAAFLIMGIAGVALRAQCPDGRPGLGACVSEAPDPVVTGSTEPELEGKSLVAMRQPEVAFDPAPVAARAVSLDQAGGMLSATFELLVDPQPASAAESKVAATAAPAVTTAAPEVTAVKKATAPALAATAAPTALSEPTAPEADSTESSSMLAKRVVRSVRIDANGKPILPISAYAETVDRADVAVTPAAAAIEAEIDGAAASNAEPAVAGSAVASIEPLDLPEPPPVSETAAPARQPAHVTGGPTNVRSGPSPSHKRLFVLAEGTEVEALAATGKWVRIVDGEGRAGWIWGEYLGGLDVSALPAPPPEAEVAAVVPAPPRSKVAPAAEAAEREVAAAPPARKAASRDVRTVKGQGVNVRSGPSSSAGKLFALAGGVEVTVTDNKRGWLRVTDKRGRTGWAYSSFLR
jgi:SH3-like domain-containing protein